MKKILSLSLGLLFWFNASAQAPLPTSANFDDPLPESWVEFLQQGNTRYVNGHIGAACRLDEDDDYVMVHFGDVASTVTYYIKGQGSALTNDIFTIQESANGQTWTMLRQLVGVQINNDSYQQYVDQPQATSRYLRWYFTDKRSGRNIALDEITVEQQIATAGQEINIYSGGAAVFTGTTFTIGNAASTVFTIENFNLPTGSPLNVSSMILTGAHASDFSISGATAPLDVAAAGTQDFTINFTAAANGSRFATLTIENDDANGDETTYVINLYGIGGNLASEPTAGATNLSFSNVSTYGFDVSFQAGTPAAEKYIVVRGVVDATALAAPVDGETYVKGDYIDNVTQVVHVGSAGTFRPSHVMADADYQFRVYAVNGPDGFENYLLGNPLAGSVSTPVSMVGSYYQGVDVDAPNFLSAVQNVQNTSHSQVFYSNYAPAYVIPFEERDTTGGQKVVDCRYSGFQHIYTGQFFYNPVGDLSREHTYAYSWMPTWPDQDNIQYSDVHNLYPVHQNNANATRSNYPLGIVVNPTSTFLDGKLGFNADGIRVYEPRDAHKGNAARAIFYMAARYHSFAENWSLPEQISFTVLYGQDQDILKQWHWQDVPDRREIARNDFIASIQGSRNPFIDNPNWVCRINFKTMELIDDPEVPCITTPNSMEEAVFGTVSIYPNPADGLVNISLDMKNGETLTADILDMTGRSVKSLGLNAAQGQSRHQLDFTGLTKGVYLLRIQGGTGHLTSKVILK